MACVSARARACVFLCVLCRRRLLYSHRGHRRPTVGDHGCLMRSCLHAIFFDVMPALLNSLAQSVFTTTTTTTATAVTTSTPITITATTTTTTTIATTIATTY